MTVTVIQRKRGETWEIKVLCDVINELLMNFRNGLGKPGTPTRVNKKRNQGRLLFRRQSSFINTGWVLRLRGGSINRWICQLDDVKLVSSGKELKRLFGDFGVLVSYEE